ncbi:MAG: ATP-binding cassette domain-containing protein, partial [Bacillota bacterium]|nr:ATP-binding cassette domain-containing protein [Bacillota bacterium]
MGTLKLDGLVKRYPNGVQAVNGFDMDIKDGEFVVLVGPSGCGKST